MTKPRPLLPSFGQPMDMYARQSAGVVLGANPFPEHLVGPLCSCKQRTVLHKSSTMLLLALGLQEQPHTHLEAAHQMIICAFGKGIQ